STESAQRSNRAPTVASAAGVNAHAPKPALAHAPLQPENVDPGRAAARNDTRAPRSNAAEHVPPQSTEPSPAQPVPRPEPVRATDSETVAEPNVATTERVASATTLHIPVPLQSPDQPRNAYCGSATAVSATFVFSANAAAHPVWSPHFTPGGTL